MSNDHIIEVCKKVKVSLPYTNAEGKSRTLTLESTNFLLYPNGVDDKKGNHYDFYCESAIGLKTGTTSAAGNCFLGLFELDGRYIIIGVFGGPDWTDRFNDTLALWKYYLEMSELKK